MDSYACQSPCKAADFPTLSALDAHLEQDHVTPNLKCFICHNTTSSRANLLRHLREVHIRCLAPPQNISCPECPALFTAKRFTMYHYFGVHLKIPKTKLPDSCGLCEFKGASKMRQHFYEEHCREVDPGQEVVDRRTSRQPKRKRSSSLSNDRRKKKSPRLEKPVKQVPAKKNRIKVKASLTWKELVDTTKNNAGDEEDAPKYRHVCSECGFEVLGKMGNIFLARHKRTHQRPVGDEKVVPGNHDKESSRLDSSDDSGVDDRGLSPKSDKSHEDDQQEETPNNKEDQQKETLNNEEDKQEETSNYEEGNLVSNIDVKEEPLTGGENSDEAVQRSTTGEKNSGKKDVVVEDEIKDVEDVAQTPKNSENSANIDVVDYEVKEEEGVTNWPTSDENSKNMDVVDFEVKEEQSVADSLIRDENSENVDVVDYEVKEEEGVADLPTSDQNSGNVDIVDYEVKEEEGAADLPANDEHNENVDALEPEVRFNEAVVVEHLGENGLRALKDEVKPFNSQNNAFSRAMSEVYTEGERMLCKLCRYNQALPKNGSLNGVYTHICAVHLGLQHRCGPCQMTIRSQSQWMKHIELKHTLVKDEGKASTPVEVQTTPKSSTPFEAEFARFLSS